jgi:anti-anti-sigma factor
MKLETRQRGDLTVLAPAGNLDTSLASELEKTAVSLVERGVRSVAVDFSDVGLITSDGIRVLVMLQRRLAAVAGVLTLCALNERTRRILDIARLGQHFRVVASVDEALVASSGPSAGAPAAASELSRLVAGLLGGSTNSAGPTAPATGAATAPSALADCVARLFAGND